MLHNLLRKVSSSLLSLTLVSGMMAGVGYASSDTGTPTLEWSRQYGMDEQFFTGRDVASTSDGGSIVTANFSASTGQTRILKLNSSGKMQWERTIQHDTSRLTTANETMETRDGGFLAVGSIQSQNGKHNILLIKLGVQGNIVWEKEYDLGFSASSLSLAETQDGGYVITGESYGWPNGQHAFVLKADTQGQELWLKKLKFSDEQYYTDIIATPDGGSIAVGTQYDLYFNDPNKGALITKLNANGEEAWTKKLSTPDSLRTATSIAPSEDGGYVIYSKSSRDDHYLTQIDSSGEIKWEKRFDSPTDRVLFKKIVPFGEGYALFSEYRNTSNAPERKYQLWELDNTGESVNKQDFTIKGFDRMTGLTPSADGGFVLLGEVKGPDYNRYIQVTKLAGPHSQPGERTLEDIRFADTSITLAVGEHTAPLLIGTYSDGSKETINVPVSLTSDDNGIAAVDPKGFITGINPGTTSIYAEFKGHQAKLSVKVYQNPNLGDSLHWSYQYGTEQSYMQGRSITPASDGGYIITADTRDQLYGSTKAYILKLNADGSLKWQHKIQHGLSEFTLPLKAMETSDGGIIVCGITRIQDFRARNQVFLAKLSAQGTLEWEKEFDGGGNKSGNSVDETTDGGFVVTGATLSISGEDLAYVLKTNAHGELLWDKRFRFESNQNYNDIIATPDGGSIAVGTINTYVGSKINDRAIVTKLSPDGDEIWTKKFAPAGRDAYSIIRADQNYLIASRAPDGVNYLTELSASGDVIWDKSYEAIEGQHFYIVSRYQQGYVLLGNYTTGEYPDRQSRLIALQLDNEGQVVSNLHFSEANVSGLDMGTVSSDGEFVFMGAVQVGEDKTGLQVTKSAGSDQPLGDPEFFLDSEEYSLAAGTSLDTVVYFKDKYGKIHNVTPQTKFESENPAVVDYDKDGNIIAVRAGITYITAEYQGMTYRALVQVVRASVPNK
ncbi:hypothetical protein [Paenibacillus sp. YPG26]|uniref:hypothetical protein n=1 Tax=Paenibacillus sp. YPG26 TaxID=2878915 RepID=UPI00203D7582|nr:hypothetical protein [Paenibacillus sp. YPG26]USB31646.1 hypothetical protein LDO05_09795 [Paenibacillus sp. YPG26]